MIALTAHSSRNLARGVAVPSAKMPWCHENSTRCGLPSSFSGCRPLLQCHHHPRASRRSSALGDGSSFPLPYFFPEWTRIHPGSGEINVRVRMFDASESARFVSIPRLSGSPGFGGELRDPENGAANSSGFRPAAFRFAQIASVPRRAALESGPLIGPFCQPLHEC